MKCMFCGSMESKVIDSRPTDEGSSIRRRRECCGCGKRFTTYETSEELPVMVVKRDGRREGYDREKVLSGVRKACEKRPIPASAIDALVQDVSRDVFNTLLQEIPSTQIGEMVMQHLKNLWLTCASRPSTASLKTSIPLWTRSKTCSATPRNELFFLRVYPARV